MRRPIINKQKILQKTTKDYKINSCLGNKYAG